MQIIRLIEESPMNVKQTLAKLNINRSAFYKWHRWYQQGGLRNISQSVSAAQAVLEPDPTMGAAASG
jgi:transposase-like protein